MNRTELHDGMELFAALGITNADVVRADYTPCERNPNTGELFRLTDTFHGLASQERTEDLLMCSVCYRTAKKQAQRP